MAASKTKPAEKPEADAEAPAEQHPTPEEAREMFAENPGLWSVMTTEGNKLRGEC